MTQPLSVAMITANFHPYIGGAEKQALELSRTLAERGVRVTVLTRRRSGLAREEHLCGVRVLRLWTIGEGVFNSLAFLLSIFSHLMIHARDYDILHAHLASSPAVAAALAARLTGRKAFVKLGGGRLVSEVGLSRGTILGRFKLGALGLLRPRIVAVDRGLSDELTGYGLERLSVEIVPNGVDTRQYSPLTAEDKRGRRKELGLPNRLTLMYAGRLAAEKRLDIFLDVFASTLGEAPEEPLLVIAGTGPEEGRLKAQAESLQMGSRVLFVGPRHDIFKFYQAADVFVLPSISEGLPNALLEAMSSSLVVLASGVGGIPGVVQDGKNGFIFEPPSPDRLRLKLSELYHSRDRFEELGRRARETMLERCSLERTADRYMEIYGFKEEK